MTTSLDHEVLTYSNCPVPNALLTALESRRLAEAGITLEVLTGTLGALHFTYDHPRYTRFGGEIPPLISEGLRAPGRTRLLGITRFAGRQGFYAAADSALTAPSDLRGTRIGVSSAAIRILRRDLGIYRELDPWAQTLTALGTWEARGLLSTLQSGGVELDEVRLVAIETPGVDLSPNQLHASPSVRGADLFPAVAVHQAAILDSERVDALFSRLPWAAELEDLCGARLLTNLSDNDRNIYASVWTVSAVLVEAHPDLVQRMVDAVVDAGVWARDHDDEVVGIHAENLGVAPAAIGRGFGSEFAQNLIPRLDDYTFNLVEQTQRFLYDRNLIDRLTDLSRWAAPAFLVESRRQLVKGA
ncbi:2'-hydroxybiphenyl-2-sulfinate desulfinase [Candidatus Mycobacterium wuenschmannii]|uniref:2'-hydroxybiphenyl-2-sulfinate desulfinase n=1 Tax=Candidatus Mycobacterium wuenschmannii TaxID=3027808 RepID=A0ABY8VQM4_9MYCO|nr:2'-hydroxybiphenyl-2-sulfinate desulfinase [Candidatus Mycobacterium wuenschmannii]WIM85935.1 2'-hydroxybiphenyl-2-sulfinate desulfinase [Candidatus Mycobacterium wuenschmannii]